MVHYTIYRIQGNPCFCNRARYARFTEIQTYSCTDVTTKMARRGLAENISWVSNSANVFSWSRRTLLDHFLLTYTVFTLSSLFFLYCFLILSCSFRWHGLHKRCPAQYSTFPPIPLVQSFIHSHSSGFDISQVRSVTEPSLSPFPVLVPAIGESWRLQKRRNGKKKEKERRRRKRRR